MVSDYVVDGSVALKWLIDDEADVLRARAILSDILSGHARLVVPPHYVSEVGNGLIMASRRKRIVLHRLAEAWADFLSIPRVETPWHPLLDTQTFELARESSLTYYDAAYVALTAMHSASFMTADNQAAETAQRMNLRVTLLK
jgi:predicted nucleic acid-binding protein